MITHVYELCIPVGSTICTLTAAVGRYAFAIYRAVAPEPQFRCHELFDDRQHGQAYHDVVPLPSTTESSCGHQWAPSR